MRYFIRARKTSGDRVLGPFDPIETLHKAAILRQSGVEYFITEEDRPVVVTEDEIRRREE
jgi:hypothetical protein